ncbi:MAG: response regulator [Candidatus Gorgyraea atricola]|nr:response regulator [Candidatus Gorgyraea atricola]
MRKILIVDDEKDLLETLAYRLKSSGYEVITAGDGQEGMDKAKKERPDLIILDFMLPKMPGYDVCKALKSDEKYKKIPVLMFTARAQETDEEKSRQAGAEAYITKPFESKELLAKIKKLLGE